MMAERRRTSRSGRRLGKQPPRYYFFLNPYTDARFTRCPKCAGKTRVRKLPLVIHIDPQHLISLNKTCKYCPYCDLLIANQDEIEGFLAAYFGANQPEVVGNDYLVVGTVDRADWLRGMHSEVAVQDMLERLHDFRDYVQYELEPRWGQREPS